MHESQKCNNFYVMQAVSNALCDQQEHNKSAFFLSRALSARNNEEVIEIASTFVLIQIV